MGREGLLVDLEAGLSWGRSVAVEALHSSGGVGKTALVVHWAHRVRHPVSGRAVVREPARL